jgi:hypothetical protein
VLCGDRRLGALGFFAAIALLKGADPRGVGCGGDVRVEMLPTPWRLVHSGVAPDHPKISR